MTSKHLRFLLLIVAAAAIFLFMAKKPGGQSATQTSSSGSPSGPASGAPAKPGTRSTPPPRPVKEPLPAIDPAKSVDSIREEIVDLSTQYSPAAIKPIAAYLYHTDPAVRDEARRGLVQLGEADAVPILREAAKQELDPQEAKALTEAADFLALPEATIPVRKKTK